MLLDKAWRHSWRGIPFGVCDGRLAGGEDEAIRKEGAAAGTAAAATASRLLLLSLAAAALRRPTTTATSLPPTTTAKSTTIVVSILHLPIIRFERLIVLRHIRSAVKLLDVIIHTTRR